MIQSGLSSCRPYAVKMISKDSGKFNKAALEKEVAILKAIEHPNCMQVYLTTTAILVRSFSGSYQNIKKFLSLFPVTI